MSTVFKRTIGTKEYVFYRTLLVNDVVYFAMSGNGEERNVLRIIKDVLGNWNIDGLESAHVNGYAVDFAEAVAENEKGFKF